MTLDIANRRNSALQQLSTLFMRYRKALAYTVARIVRPQDVEDVVQETYLRIYQAAQRTPIQHPKSFMLKTARNIALNHVGSADAMNHLAAARWTEEGPEHGTDTASLETFEQHESDSQSNEEFLIFCRAVRELPVQCRRVFVLRKVYGLSQRETAQQLGISETTVEKHVAKGIVACEVYMKTLDYARGHKARERGMAQKSS